MLMRNLRLVAEYVVRTGCRRWIIGAEDVRTQLLKVGIRVMCCEDFQRSVGDANAQSESGIAPADTMPEARKDFHHRQLYCT
jgi:hypothetical protein